LCRIELRDEDAHAVAAVSGRDGTPEDLWWGERERNASGRAIGWSPTKRHGRTNEFVKTIHKNLGK